MKAMIAIFLITVLNQLAAQSDPGDWVAIDALPFAGRWDDIHIASTADEPTVFEAWAVNSEGQIYHAADLSEIEQWTPQFTAPFFYLRAVDFLDDGLIGFVGSLNGAFFKTENGGQTWSDISTDIPGAETDICGLAHAGDSIWGVGVFADPAYLIQSNDRGQTWSWTSMEDYASALVEIQVGPSGDLFAAGRTDTGATILRSDDGGLNWETVFAGNGGVEFIWKLDFVDDQIAYGSLESFGGNTSFVSSNDGGQTWIEGEVSPDYFDLQGVGFLDGETGWVSPRNSALLLTTDGGQTWTPDEQPSNVNRIAFPRELRAPALAGGNFVYYFQANPSSINGDDTKILLPDFGPIYPNPVSGQASVRLKLIRSTRVSVDLLDPLGRPLREIHRGRLPVGKHLLPLGDLSGYPAGSYLLALRTSEGHQSIPLIIK
ncbi:MAG: YCF48-related protein [Bacteroidota bacterium]